MIIVFNQKDFEKELEKQTKAEETLFYEEPITNMKEFRKFQRFLLNSLIKNRFDNFQLKGKLNFEQLNPNLKSQNETKT